MTEPVVRGLITRGGWGADESLGLDSAGSEIWPVRLWPVQKLIVHHTAWPGDERADAATVRQIHREHASARGWGDIGYSYLVGPDGAVYAGRPEGAAGAHAEGFNAGTAGVAVLGTFTESGPTAEARAALVGLLAALCERHAIHPVAESPYENPVTGRRATLPGVAGHRDIAATECPGEALYAELPAIRRAAAGRSSADGNG